MRDGMSSAEHLRLLVGTEGGLYELGAREQRHFDGEEITALAPDGGAWWALVAGRMVWRSRPDGSWEQVAAIEAAAATCLAPAPAGLLVGTTGAHLLRLRDGRLERCGTARCQVNQHDARH